MADNLFTLVKTQLDCMTKTERKIATFLLEQPEDFMRTYIPVLAEQIQVSQGSIHNFAKKMDCNGFSALKLRIAKDLKDYRQSRPARNAAPHLLKEQLRAHIKQCNDNMTNTYELNTEESLKKAADRILSSKRIQLHGVYHSGIAAQDFCYQLIQLGIPATYISDPLIGAVSATMQDEQSLVIAISASGRTKEILDTVAFAKDKGASILAITSDRFSPLAKFADITLLTAAGEAFATKRFNHSRIAQLFIIDALCAHLHSRINTGSMEYDHQLAEILSSHNVCD